MNEHIVASAIYYYDNHNITDSYLSFRTKVDPDGLDERDVKQDGIKSEQVDFDGISRAFGIDNYDSFIQDVGSILTREDRLIVFPNGFQHCVGEFKLADPTQPGHRKILALFLVAPDTPILSTSNVPPQQRDWWRRELVTGATRLGELPAEVMDMIADEVEDFPIGMEEAKRIREQLMAERTQLDDEVDNSVRSCQFNFCEH